LTTTTIDFSTFAGAGFAPSPGSTQLDSDNWAITGFDAGDLVFGGTMMSTDFARGLSTSASTAGGIYAADVDDTATTNRALSIQATSTDATPGTVTLRWINVSGVALTKVHLSYTIYVRNDGDYATTFDVSVSTNNTSYTAIPTLNYSSPLGASGSAWVAILRAEDLSIAVAPNGLCYVRWTTDDVPGGSGSRDEIAIDDIAITPIFDAPGDAGADAGFDAGFDAGADAGDAGDAGDAALGSGGAGTGSGQGDASSNLQDASALLDATVFDASAPALDGAVAADSSAPEVPMTDDDGGAGGSNTGSAGTTGATGGTSNAAGNANESDAGFIDGIATEEEAGCSCSAVGSRSPNAAWAMVAASLGLALARRTRRPIQAHPKS
jgi:MYXO-CTERM domain-containing protein